MRRLLQPLNRRKDGPALVAVDFRGARPGADIRGLADTAERPVWEFTAARWAGVKVDPDARAYAAAYADALAESPCEDVRLLGFCAGSMLALELARELRARGRAVALTLIDPLPIGVEFLAVVHAQITRAPSAEVRAGLGRLAGDGPATFAYLAGLAQEHHERQCASLGIPADDEIALDLIDRYLSWIEFAVAASTARRTPYPGPAAVLLSADYGDRAAVEDHWEVDRFAADQADMLRDPAVLEAILRRVS
ncbi:thioesterase domain-containing protein [Actinomadura terrae]|uniref:thioesterase domain-containing protein n=1 Tax=Actinomadura terrae TaxID=604353 RepID=UPI001FA7236F|nr:thioesterase domain-containing protein [Actinomadura terrae]